MSKLKSKFTVAILLGAGSLFAASAFAVDGQILINQSTVMAAGGFPYKITQPGSYKLSGNLTVPANADGIDITADNVTLDLNGFNISGPLKCTFAAAGVSCSGSVVGWGVFSGQNNTTVKNGSISGMANGGVDAGSGSGSGALIEEVSVSQNGVGIAATGIVRRCTASLNRAIGITVDRGVVEDNALFENQEGMSVAFATVTGNAVSLSVTVGMESVFTTFGSNSFSQNKSANVSSGTGTTSQNNNNCDGGTC
jgi:hypothetical protein